MCTLSELFRCCATDAIQSMGGSLVSVEKVAKHVTYTTHAVVCSRIPAVHTFAANNAVKHAIRTFHATRLDTGASNAV